MLKFKQGQKISKYTLKKKLGKGGNGQVWKTESDGKIVALKILNTVDFKGYFYKRFKSEIEFLKKDNKRQGILNILDSNLPSNYQKNDYAWYTMPIAVSLKEYIDSVNLTSEHIIEVFTKIATILADLHSQEVYHRDIKPDNLFYLENSPKIGDFGLVAFPDKENITENKKLGPTFFIAPEMLNSPDSADASKADVYSLAKTFWVFLTKQNYPLPGQHDPKFQQSSLSSWIQIPKIYILDNLLKRATEIDPIKRMTMSEFYNELFAWNNQYKKSDHEIDIKTITADLLHELTPQIDKESLCKEYVIKAEKVLRDLHQKIDPLIDKDLKKLVTTSTWNKRGTTNPFAIQRTTIKDREDLRDRYVYSLGDCYVIEIKEKKATLWIGGGCELFDNETINIALGFQIRIDDQYNNDVWCKSRFCPLDSAQQINATGELVEEFGKQLVPVLSDFLKEVKSR